MSDRIRKSGDGSGLCGGDVGLHVLVEQQTLLLEALGGGGYQAHIGRMVLVALLEGEARIAASVRLGPGEGKSLTRSVAPVCVHWVCLGAQGPAGIGSEWHGNVRRVDSG